ncbi:MAG: hypothetical protein MUF00_18665 [Gemmatimonadaceae bacterium]|nr:hypothetical protein [Gemmatimonadaceae bacterium]
MLDLYDHPDLVADRARFAAEPAFWDDNSEIIRRARIRISIDAFTVTRGRATAWTTGALPLLFDVRHLDAVPAELYRTADDREQAALALLEKTARRVGMVQDSAGIWHLPAGADEG